MSITVSIITYNEENNIEDCLESVRWADEIVVVDAESTDQTIHIAKRFNAKTYKLTFTNFAAQKNFAIDKATKNWVFFLDADERVTESLALEIRETLSQADSDSKVYAINRRTFFFGKELHHSGCQEDYPIRLFPRNKARFQKPVHEEVITSLPIIKLKNQLIHLSTRNWEHYKRKLDLYIPFELEVMKAQSRRKSLLDLFARPLGQFVRLYFIKKGFLDGITGFKYAVLSSYYSWLKHWKFIST